MGDTAEGSWTSRELGGFIRREEARKRADMSTHTPGPWRVGPYYRHEVVSDAGIICYAPIETEQTRVNARLIAAAPELLEACQRAAAAIRQEQPGLARRVLEAAIARAEQEKAK